MNRWEMAGVSYLLSLIIFIFLPASIRTSENLYAVLESLTAVHGRAMALTIYTAIGFVLSIIPALAVLGLAKITDRFFQDGSWINQAIIFLGGIGLGVFWPLWVY